MNEPLITPPTPPSFAETTARKAIIALQALDRSNREGLRDIWMSPDRKTPQQKFDELGTRAARLVVGSAKTTAFLVEQFADAGLPYTPPALPSGVSLNFNMDGPPGPDGNPTPGTVTVVGWVAPVAPGRRVVTGAPGVEVVPPVGA